MQINTDDKQFIFKKVNVLWGIIYALLASVIIIFAFMIFRIVSGNMTMQVSSIIELQPVEISIQNEVIKRGELVEINIKNGTNETFLISSNPDVISIDGYNIIGISEGEANIFASQNEEISNVLNIKCIIKLEKIGLNNSEVEIEIGGNANLFATLVPEDIQNVELIYQSEDESIATINDGIIEGISEGETVITVEDNKHEQKAFCKVYVKPIEVTDVSLDETNVTLGIEQNYILRATISPYNATYKNIIWTSSDNNVITVDNGKIKAVGIGNATVSAIAKNGIKESCTFNVREQSYNNNIKYVVNSFNVRTGPGTEYTKLDSVETNDEIEILKETDSWAKIRIVKNGIVGYTVVKSYTSEKSYYIYNVPFLNQLTLGYPTGCEAVSAVMAARFEGYNIDIQTIVDSTPYDYLGKRQETRTKEIEKTIIIDDDSEENNSINITGENKEIEKEEKTKIVKETVEETIWIGENPFKYFVGYPTKGQSEGSYGCFAEPIEIALKNNGIFCTNISGCSTDTLYSYIRQGKPVIVWGRRNAMDITEGVTWTYPDGSGSFVELVGEHCFVLIGYDKDYVYVNDPVAGAGVKQPKWKFESNWHILYDQAIIIN